MESMMENLKDPMTLPDYHFGNDNPKRQREKFVDVYNDAVNHGHTSFIEDVVPVAPGLKKFYDEFKHKNPEVAFVINASPRHTVNKSADEIYFVYNTIRITYTDAPDLILGALMVTYNENRETLYGVGSESIRNERYASHNNEHRIKRSKDFKTAIKTARQYLKPMSVKNLCNDLHHVRDMAQSQITSPASAKMYEAFNIAQSAVREEVEAMLSFGYTPKTQAFTKAFDLLRTEGEELKRIANYKPKATFVWLKTTSAHMVNSYGEETVAHTMDAVPEDIRNKIAVLQIGSNRSAVMNVGVKVDDTKYWVFE
jgi:hypothetical protein